MTTASQRRMGRWSCGEGIGGAAAVLELAGRWWGCLTGRCSTPSKRGINGGRHSKRIGGLVVRAVSIDAHPDHVRLPDRGGCAFDAKLTKSDIPGSRVTPSGSSIISARTCG